MPLGMSRAGISKCTLRIEVLKIPIRRLPEPQARTTGARTVFIPICCPAVQMSLYSLSLKPFPVTSLKHPHMPTNSTRAQPSCCKCSHKRIMICPRWTSYLPPLGNPKKTTSHGLLKHYKVTSLPDPMWTMRMRTNHQKPSITRIGLLLRSSSPIQLDL